MRRSGRIGIPWVSMMDLLFGMFGALIVLTALISLKLGRTTGIDQRPFQSLTIELSATDAELREALKRMHIGLRLFDSSDASAPICTFSATSLSTQSCLPNIDPAPPAVRLTEFATSVVGEGSILLASLLINTPKQNDSIGYLAIQPVLADFAVALDTRAKIRDDSLVEIRLSAKTIHGVLEPPALTIEFVHLLALAKKDPLVGAPLMPPGTDFCGKDVSDQASCEVISSEGGRIVFHQ